MGTNRWFVTAHKVTMMLVIVTIAASALLPAGRAAAASPDAQPTHPSGKTARPGHGAPAMVSSGLSQASTGGLGGVTMFDAPSFTGSGDIARGADGDMWFTDFQSPAIGRVTPSGTVTRFADSRLTETWGITAGPDGNMWFAVGGSYPNFTDSAIGKITPQGQITLYYGSAISSPTRISAGPDGNLWFVAGVNGAYVGRITTDGTATVVAWTPYDLLFGITAGPDGAMWFTGESLSSSTHDGIGRVTMDGSTSYYSDSSIWGPSEIVTGPDGNLWFTNTTGCCSSIGRITPSGLITSYAATWIKYPAGIVAGPDGNLWFMNSGNVGDTQQVGRITRSGVLTGFTTNGNYGSNLVVGPDANLWFTSTNKIGRFALGLNNGIKPTRMVSLGDSFTSGEGLLPGDNLSYDCGTDLHKGTYFENTSVGVGSLWGNACDTITKGPPPINYATRPWAEYANLCHRHGRAWVNQARQSFGISASNSMFVACSGAVAGNVGYLNSGDWAQYPLSPNSVAGAKTQKDTVASFAAPPYKAVDFVTIGVGGNDAGFSDIVEFCLFNDCLHDSGKPTFAADTLATINNSTFSRLVETFTNVRAAFPAATILTYGYPQVLDPNTPSCAGIHGIGGHAYDLSVEERTWAAGTLLPTLNRAVEDAAAAAGITFMPIEDVTKGHEVCTSDPWVNGLRTGDDVYGVVANESFHPNQKAHDAIFKYFNANFTDGNGRLTFQNPTPNSSVLKNHQNTTVIVGQTQGQPSGSCGASCLQPACSSTLCGVDLSLTSFSPYTTLTVTDSASSVVLGTAATDATGHVQKSFTVPATVADGSRTMVISGTSAQGVQQVGEVDVGVHRTTLAFPTPPPGTAYHPVDPARVLDSRTPNGGWNGPLIAGGPRNLKVTGLGGASNVPPSATAVVMNVTATGSTAGSFLTAWPAGIAKPNASNLNFGANETIANLVTVKIGANGNVAFADAVGQVDVVADVVGFYDDGSGGGDLFNGNAPTRLLDSRTSKGGWSGKLQSGTPRDLVVRQPTNSDGVPATATAVIANVTVTDGTQNSFLSVWPSGIAQPSVSNINFATGQTIPNLAIIKIGANGAIRFANATGSVHLVVDLMGYFDPTTGSKFHAINPTRILDDRVSNGLSGSWTPGQTRTLAVTGAVGTSLPLGATGLATNVTATGGTVGSFVTVTPSGVASTASNLNFGPGETIPNLVIVKINSSNQIDIYNALGSVDIIADAVGYYAQV